MVGWDAKATLVVDDVIVDKAITKVDDRDGTSVKAVDGPALTNGPC